MMGTRLRRTHSNAADPRDERDEPIVWGGYSPGRRLTVAHWRPKGRFICVRLVAMSMPAPPLRDSLPYG